MIRFVNAKINLGLDIVERRKDGYHNLETVFYPVGINSGTPSCPSPFADILEIVEREQTADRQFSSQSDVYESAYGDIFLFNGRKVDCAPEKNLVVKSVALFRENCEQQGISQLPSLAVVLEKHLPDGAGLGGGSADASFCLCMLNDMADKPFSEEEMIRLAAGIGADCPFFIINRCCFAEGIGDRLTLLPDLLKEKWCVIAKPFVSVSTKEAFSGVTPRRPEFNLRDIATLPYDRWRECLVNDFEDSLFPAHPELESLKEHFYNKGAFFSLMSGSGSSVYALFHDYETADSAMQGLKSTQSGVWLLEL